MEAASGPAQPATLPPRWGSDSTEESAPAAEAGGNLAAGEKGSGSGGNMFVSGDQPAPLVMAAQGASISGQRSLGFATGLLPSYSAHTSLNTKHISLGLIALPQATVLLLMWCRCVCLPAGGAQDVENFRQNIKQGYLPLPTDVTFEGIVKDYYFDTT